MPTFISNFPLAGTNWKELFNAYRLFLTEPDTGVKHLIAAQRYTKWEVWVRERLTKQAGHLKGHPLQINLAELAKLPEDTLGGRYARHMIALGLDPNVFINKFDDEDWLDQRSAIAHDLFHVITGFDADVLGEYGLAAFSLSQHRDMLHTFILSFAPISLLRPNWTIPLLRNLRRGFMLGKQSKPMIGYAFEKNWEKPLSQVRQELGIGSLFPQEGLQTQYA